MGGGGGGGGRESDILTGTVGVAADAIGDPARQPAPVCCFMPCYYGIILVFFLVVSLFSCLPCSSHPCSFALVILTGAVRV